MWILGSLGAEALPELSLSLSLVKTMIIRCVHVGDKHGRALCDRRRRFWARTSVLGIESLKLYSSNYCTTTERNRGHVRTAQADTHTDTIRLGRQRRNHCEIQGRTLLREKVCKRIAKGVEDRVRMNHVEFFEFFQPCETDCAYEYAAKGEGSWVEGERAGGVETVEEAGLGEKEEGEALRFRGGVSLGVVTLWEVNRENWLFCYCACLW